MKFQKLLLSILFCVVFIACKDQNPQSETNNIFKFKNYINYTTSGLISVAEPIKIELAKEVEGWISNQEVSEKFFSISPSINGKLSAVNSRSLLFQPSKNLEPNKEYTVTVYLGKIYNNIPSEFKTFTFKFKTIEQNFSVTTTSFQSYSKESKPLLNLPFRASEPEVRNFRHVPDCLKSADYKSGAPAMSQNAVVHINQNRGSTYPKSFNISRAKQNRPAWIFTACSRRSKGPFPRKTMKK